MAEDNLIPMDATALSPALRRRVARPGRGWLSCSGVCPHRMLAMTTLMPRDRGLTYLSEMTHHSGPETAAPDQQPAPRPPDRRHQRRWVPVTAAFLALLVGLASIIQGFRTRGLDSPLKPPLHRLTEHPPGLLATPPP